MAEENEEWMQVAEQDIALANPIKRWLGYDKVEEAEKASMNKTYRDSIDAEIRKIQNTPEYRRRKKIEQQEIWDERLENELRNPPEEPRNLNPFKRKPKPYNVESFYES